MAADGAVSGLPCGDGRGEVSVGGSEAGGAGLREFQPCAAQAGGEMRDLPSSRKSGFKDEILRGLP